MTDAKLRRAGVVSIAMKIAVCVALLLAAACSRSSDPDSSPSNASPTVPGETTTSTTEPPRGGTARVAVWQKPDPDAATITGTGVRALVLPQLHRAKPDGTWEPWLIEAGSVREAPDLTSVSFMLREGAVWSDGSPVGPADLGRDADLRVVDDISATPDGEITVTFTQPLPGWRDLWSGDQAIAPPAPGVWGGPFVVESIEPDLRTVLTPNPNWWGSGPFLDRLELVLVPDDVTARQLLERGEIDVVMPRATNARISTLAAIENVTVSQSAPSGWWFGAVASPDMAQASRAGLLSLIDERTFVDTLLDGEATVLDGFSDPPIWGDPMAGDVQALAGATIDVVLTDEDPMAGLVHRVMARSAPDSARIERKAADADVVASFAANGEFDLLLSWHVDDPDICWRCAVLGLDEATALAADSGDDIAVRAAQQRLRDDALTLPMWRPTAVVATRGGLSGPVANGFARIGAWNAEAWFRTDAG